MLASLSDPHRLPWRRAGGGVGAHPIITVAPERFFKGPPVAPVMGPSRPAVGRTPAGAEKNWAPLKIRRCLRSGRGPRRPEDMREAELRSRSALCSRREDGRASSQPWPRWTESRSYTVTPEWV
jgi:hypothetical protein